MSELVKPITIQTRKLVVLGTSHQLQGKKFPRSIDDQCYRDLVEQLILVNKLDFVFEEAAGYAPTDAELLAKACPQPIGYMDVDPSKDEREQYGLSGDTGESYMVDLWQSPPCVARTEQVAKHAAREEFWLERIHGQDFAFALMVCGDAHGLSFSFRLRSAGFDVESCISYMPYDKLCRHAGQPDASAPGK
jgi:hypothetical protein